MIRLNGFSFFSTLKNQGTALIKNVRDIPFPSFSKFKDLVGSSKMAATVTIVAGIGVLFALALLVKGLWNRNMRVPASSNTSPPVRQARAIPPALLDRSLFQNGEMRVPEEFTLAWSLTLSGGPSQQRRYEMEALGTRLQNAADIGECQQIMATENCNKADLLMLIDSLITAEKSKPLTSGVRAPVCEKIATALNFLFDGYAFNNSDASDNPFSCIEIKFYLMDRILLIGMDSIIENYFDVNEADVFGFSFLTYQIHDLENRIIARNLALESPQRSEALREQIDASRAVIGRLINASSTIKLMVKFTLPPSMKDYYDHADALAAMGRGCRYGCGAVIRSFERRRTALGYFCREQSPVEMNIRDLTTDPAVQEMLSKEQVKNIDR